MERAEEEVLEGARQKQRFGCKVAQRPTARLSSYRAAVAQYGN